MSALRQLVKRYRELPRPELTCALCDKDIDRADEPVICGVCGDPERLENSLPDDTVREFCHVYTDMQLGRNAIATDRLARILDDIAAHWREFA